MTQTGAQVGVVGLGTMGRGLAEALARAGLEVHAFEPMENGAAPSGVTLASEQADLVAALAPPAASDQLAEVLETTGASRRVSA